MLDKFKRHLLGGVNCRIEMIISEMDKLIFKNTDLQKRIEILENKIARLEHKKAR